MRNSILLGVALAIPSCGPAPVDNGADRNQSATAAGGPVAAQPPPGAPAAGTSPNYDIAGPPAGTDDVGACRLDKGKVLPPNRLKAIGTEPFWAAEVEGRCVTYSTPENQQGTRIWTQFDGSRDSGVWTGAHAGKPFVLRSRRSPGCSDGMSDRRYPVAVTLVVGGEERLGCADWPDPPAAAE